MPEYGVDRSTREQAIVASLAGQTVFGPLTFTLDDEEDLGVDVQTLANPAAGYLPRANGFSVAIDALTGFPTVTFDAPGFVVGDSVWFRSIRLDARENDVTAGGAIHSRPFENEEQRFTRVLQELRRDVGRAVSVGYVAPPAEPLPTRLPPPVPDTVIGYDDDGQFKNYPTLPNGTGIAYEAGPGVVIDGNEIRTDPAVVPTLPIERAELAPAIAPAVDVTPMEFGAVGDGIADDRAALAAAATAVGTAGAIVIPNGKTFRMGSALTIQSEIIFRGGKLNCDGNSAPLTNNSIKISEYLNSYTSIAFAVEQAFKRLLTSGTQHAIDLEGMRVFPERRVVINEALLGANWGGASSIGKFVINGMFKPDTAGVWNADERMLHLESTLGTGVGGSGAITNLHFIGVTFDTSNSPTIQALWLGGYYQIKLLGCFLHHRGNGNIGIFSAQMNSAGTVTFADHGLELDMLNIRTFNPTEATIGVKCYAGDVSQNGGDIEFNGLGYEFMNSASRIKDIHFSEGNNKALPPTITPMRQAVIFRDPANCEMLGCEMDHCNVLVTNDRAYDPRLTFVANNFGHNVFINSRPAADGEALFTFEAAQPNTVMGIGGNNDLDSNRAVLSNDADNPGGNLVKLVKCRTKGAGTFSAPGPYIGMRHMAGAQGQGPSAPGAGGEVPFTAVVSAGMGVTILAGYGSPEGVHAAQMSSQFMSIDTGRNWVKESGAATTNTGWRRVETFLTASKAVDPPSVAAGGTSPAETIAVPGAALGDFVELSFDQPMAGLTLQGSVSAAGFVSCNFFNRLASAVDLPAGTIRARVLPQAI